MVSISSFLLPIYRSCIANIPRIKRCDNLGLSLRFQLSLQSAFCTVVCILNPISNLQSAFYTDRWPSLLVTETGIYACYSLIQCSKTFRLVFTSYSKGSCFNRSKRRLILFLQRIQFYHYEKIGLRHQQCHYFL